MRMLRPLPRPTRALIIAPSSPGNAMAHVVLMRAVDRLKQIGISCILAPNLTARSEGLAVPTELRLADFTLGLEDPDIDLIICLYGGYSSIDLLDKLPYSLWRETRKPLLGFSDITALHLAGWTQCELPGLHGPNLSNFGAPDLDPYTLEQLAAALFNPICRVQSTDHVAEDSWYEPSAQAMRDWRPHSPSVLQSGQAEGPLLGGNLSTLVSLVGTPFFPDLQGALILIESNTSTAIGEIDRDLRHLHLMGAFDDAKGIIFGALGQKNEVFLSELVQKNFDKFNGPIIAGMTCSHVDPIATLTIGAQHQLDTDDCTLEFQSPFGEL